MEPPEKTIPTDSTFVVRQLAKGGPMGIVAAVLLGAVLWYIHLTGERLIKHLDAVDASMAANAVSARENAIWVGQTARAIESMVSDQRNGREAAVDKIGQRVSAEVNRCCRGR